jgi:hypothetical protein
MEHLKTLRVVWLIVIAIGPVLPGRCQRQSACTPQKTASGSKVILGCAGESGRYRLIRFVDDPSTKQHWLLLKDLSRPANPALFVEESLEAGAETRSTSATPSRSSVPTHSIAVIHAGDSILLSEHTRIIDAEFEATALHAAAMDEVVDVRMKFGNRTLKAVATGPRRATVVEEASEEHQ